MSGVTSCRQCGCSEIDTDPSRGDAVCTSCGFVLEESIIVSEVTFEEDGHGGASAIGQFVSAESRGGGSMVTSTGAFHSGVVKESREITLRTAKKKIVEVSQQLRLNQHCIDVAFNFFKMALHKQLTKGRRTQLTIAACVYMTCRIEGTPHLLIDFCDIVQKDIYSLGRAYVQISRALYINVPAADPCMYILRFAHKFDLGEKTHEVAMTALRLVQRMKRDWIHCGRRPSGLCGAALLIASRLHSFSRSVQDIISVVKVHETTLRKRLMEFGETPSSSLTLDEFMTVDLEEEHDPPSFKAARNKDREYFQKLDELEFRSELTDIQKKIELALDKRKKVHLEKRSENEELELENNDDGYENISSIETIDENEELLSKKESSNIKEIKKEKSTKESIKLEDSKIKPTKEKENAKDDIDKVLMPPPPPNTVTNLNVKEENKESKDLITRLEEGGNGEIGIEGIDEDEIDFYIMNPIEVKRKTKLWEELNADYILEQKRKQEENEKDIKEGKTKKKRKKVVKDKTTFHAKTANEAIKIMLSERKMSNKINYDVLKTLVKSTLSSKDSVPASPLPITKQETTTIPLSMNSGSDSYITVIESDHVIPRKSKRTSIKLESDDEQNQQTSNKKLKIASKKNKVKLEPKEDKEKESEAEDDKETKAAIKEIEIIKEPPPEPEEVIEAVEETGPVQYVDDQNESDDDDDAYSSARKLLTQFRGEEEEGFEDYFD